MSGGKIITAYYCSWCYPALNSHEEDHATVKIQYHDNAWEEIFRMPLNRDDCNEIDNSGYQLARVVLEHFLAGAPVSDGQVRDLVMMPGASLCRIEPKALECFRQGVLF